MPSTLRRISSPGLCACVVVLAALLVALPGCSLVPNQFREDGPSTTADWDSPTAVDVRAHVAPAPEKQRDWRTTSVAQADGAILHEPSYFEDPFVDKGDGRTDVTHPHDVYRLGWEDYVAFPYCFGRFTINWLCLPFSAIVTPPWTVMESDGVLSRQALGYDHDAEPVSHRQQREESKPPVPAPDTGTSASSQSLG